MSLFLKFLDIKKVLLVNGYQISEFEKKFIYNFWLQIKVKVFFIKNI